MFSLIKRGMCTLHSLLMLIDLFFVYGPFLYGPKTTLKMSGCVLAFPFNSFLIVKNSEIIGLSPPIKRTWRQQKTGTINLYKVKEYEQH